MIEGTVERILVETESSPIVKVTLLLEGDKMVYSGDVFTHDNEKLVLALTKPGDKVIFRYSRDFRNQLRNFKNHTLESRELDFSSL